MGVADLIVLFLVAACVVAVLIYMRKQKKEGKSCCGWAGCSGGSGGCGCQSIPVRKKEEA